MVDESTGGLPVCKCGEPMHEGTAVVTGDGPRDVRGRVLAVSEVAATGPVPDVYPAVGGVAAGHRVLLEVVVGAGDQTAPQRGDRLSLMAGSWPLTVVACGEAAPWSGDGQLPGGPVMPYSAHA